MVADGAYTPEKIDQYQAQVEYPSANTTTTAQPILATDDQMVLATDGSRELTGPAEVTVTGPEGDVQTGDVTTYGGKVLVTKGVVGTGETLVAKVALYGLDPEQVVTWKITLPADGTFTAPPGVGQIAEGLNTVAELQALALPLSFATTGPKQIALFLEPVPSSTPPAAPPAELTGR